MKRLWMIVALVGIGSSAGADVKPFMDQMLNEIFLLKPYIVSESAFKDPKNSEKINASLKKMEELSRQINHESRIKKTGFQISGQVLSQQLKETELVFQTGNKSYSLWMLKSTLGVCMSCHTQLPAVSTKFTTLNSGHILVNPFEEAEFLFVIRNFDEAMKLYAQAIKGYPKNMVTSDSVEKSVYRQLFYYARVQRDFKSLASALKESLSNKELPKGLAKKISGLLAAADAMKAETYPSFSNSQEAEFRKYIETSLKDELLGDFKFDSPKKELMYLKVSSVLFEYLNLYPETPLKPDILYWLSLCESHYSHRTFYSLPELYLKQCVMEFPTNPVAKKCLKEYQDIVSMAFTGSSGTHIPGDVSKELKTMEKLIQKVEK